MRAIAALLVFLFHCVRVIPDSNVPYLLKWFCNAFIQQGYIGVNIFFVLSGFLIATRYIKGVTLSGSWFRRYLQNRFARIYPIYFLLTVPAFIVMVVRPTHGFYEWNHWLPSLLGKAIAVATNLTLTRAFFQDLSFIGLPTAWSLTVEETFYLFAPFLLVGLAYKRRLLYAYPFLILALGLILIPICHAVFPHLGLMTSVEFMLELTFFGRCTEFIIGIGLYFWLRRHPVSTNGYATITGIVGILLSMALLSLLAESSNPALNYVCKNIITHLLIPIPIALLFWGLITEQTRIRRFLETKTLDLLGKSSYIFYLIHLGTFDSLFRRNVTESWGIRLIVYTLASIVLYKAIESPLHKKLRSK